MPKRSLPMRVPPGCGGERRSTLEMEISVLGGERTLKRDLKARRFAS